MQRYFAGELRPDQLESWRADDGIFYLVSEVDAILTNFREAIRKYQNLIEDQDEQIDTLKEAVEKQKNLLTFQHNCDIQEANEAYRGLRIENKRLRQIVIDCHAGWPDEVLQEALRGGEVQNE